MQCHEFKFNLLYRSVNANFTFSLSHITLCWAYFCFPLYWTRISYREIMIVVIFFYLRKIATLNRLNQMYSFFFLYFFSLNFYNKHRDHLMNTLWCFFCQMCSLGQLSPCIRMTNFLFNMKVIFFWDKRITFLKNRISTNEKSCRRRHLKEKKRTKKLGQMKLFTKKRIQFNRPCGLLKDREVILNLSYCVKS